MADATARDALLDAYEAVAYVGRPNSRSHPDRLGTVATLLGMNPASVAACRVLEVGCGDGGNLIPLAAALPGSRFTGFDFAPSAIARAQRMAGALGLANVDLRTLDLRAVPGDLGEFDYIIAHGVYSWVPPDVRAHLLPLLARHLAPQGVAFVSYNTYPGCYVRRAIWEMLKYHVRDVTDHRQRLIAARSLIALLAEPATTHKGTDAPLRAELTEMLGFTDGALAHDDLSEPNDPVWFHEFAAELARNGLMYLAEAELYAMVGLGITPRVRQALGRMDRVTREQYLDFVHFRRFRQSLVCHAGALSRFAIDPARLAPMHVSASAALMAQAEEGKAFAEGDGANVRALKELLIARWPRSVPLAELPAAIAGHDWKGAEGVSPQVAIENAVVQTYGTGLLELFLHPPAAVRAPGEHPTVFAPARWQAAHGEFVTNVYHDAIDIKDPARRQLLTLLDGTRSRGQLLAEATRAFGAADGAGQLQKALDQFARAALVVG